MRPNRISEARREKRAKRDARRADAKLRGRLLPPGYRFEEHAELGLVITKQGRIIHTIGDGSND